MTDNEIIKALKCCIKAVSVADCITLKCPMFNCYGCNYNERLYELALDLINRQKAEIERLTTMHSVYKSKGGL